MRWLTLLLIHWPAELLAQPADVASTAMDPISPSYLMKLTAGLLVVVALIFFFAWLMKRLNLTQQSNGGILRIVAGLPVGTRDRIVLLQVGEEQVLVGLSPGRMEKLHTMSRLVTAEETTVTLTPFAQKLNDLMGKGSGQGSDK